MHTELMKENEQDQSVVISTYCVVKKIYILRSISNLYIDCLIG